MIWKPHVTVAVVVERTGNRFASRAVDEDLPALPTTAPATGATR